MRSESGEGFWWTQLDHEAESRRDQTQFHVFAESRHSDLRGQIYNLAAGDELPYRWPDHLFLLIGLAGEFEAIVGERVFPLRPFTQLVVYPGHEWRLIAKTEASVELLSFVPAPLAPERALQTDAPASAPESTAFRIRHSWFALWSRTLLTAGIIIAILLISAAAVWPALFAQPPLLLLGAAGTVVFCACINLVVARMSFVHVGSDGLMSPEQECMAPWSAMTGAVRVASHGRNLLKISLQGPVGFPSVSVPLDLVDPDGFLQAIRRFAPVGNPVRVLLDGSSAESTVPADGTSGG